MAQLINTNSYNNDAISQIYNEKHQLTSPQCQKRYQQTPQDFPLTPSSSAFSFLVADQKSIEEERPHKEESIRLPSNTTISTTSLKTSTSNYGSLSSDFIYFQTTSATTKMASSSSAASTISPNDDDESLYLLWTHQLLVERGYQPSSCKVNDDEDNEDNYSVDSSITDLSANQQTTISSALHNNRRSNIKREKQNSYLPSWLETCFPLC